MKKKLLRVLDGETVYPPPLWLMRQAGRYLPEYRQTRRKAGSFLDLCYTPELAVEVTLQPIRRFGFDAAILFSDILVVPHALGCDVSFEEGRGPVMTPVGADAIDRLDASMFHVNLEPVLESVRRLAAQVGEETALIGFCGAPWTVATYMIAGHGTPDQAPARLLAYRHPEAFERLIDMLADLSADFLGWQLDAGAEAVQIFDSWAGVLDQSCFESFCIRPVARMVGRLRETHPGARIIGFPKGAGGFYESYREATGVDALGLDWTVPLAVAANLQSRGAVQGNLDPLRVVAGGRALDDGVESILGMLGSGPFIFNLGHGITPNAPLDNVERLVRRVRGYGEG